MRNFGLTAATAMALGTLACNGGGEGRTSSSSTTLTGTTEGTDTATSGTATDTAGTDTATGTSSTTGGPTCDAEMCEGECVGGVCCDAEQACSDVCCGDGEVCSFNACVVPGEVCVDASECPDGWYCEYTLGEPGGGTGGMCMGGAELDTGKCLPTPPECMEGQDPGEGDDLECLTKCEYIPPTSFSPTLKFHWDAGDIMMTPIVIQLDDDNCDDIVDERDIPEIVFNTFDNGQYNNAGTLRAISIVDGAVVEKWSAKPVADAIQPGRSIAAGNIDGTPGNEVVTCTETGKVRAFGPTGAELWVSEYAGGCFMPSIADFDQDGLPEVLVEGAILNGQTGATKATFTAQVSVLAADIDGDARLEVVGPIRAYESDGTLLVDTGLAGRHPAVADLDLDGKPEVITTNNSNHLLDVWRYDPNMPGGFEIIRQGVDINGPLSADLCPVGSAGNVGGGGPPTVADFNGDGTPDVGVAGGVGYAVYDGTLLMNTQLANSETNLWISQTHDCSSAQTGSSVFDFDGNGSAEVVYSDEWFLRIYSGTDGQVLFQTCNTTGTLWEYPVIADVDNDGHADIVAVSNAYSSITCPDDNSKQNGVRVFGDLDGLWVRTRRIWNQHPYHVTNINEDGSVPAFELPNWTQPRLNNYRQNVQPEGEFSAPDLVVSVRPFCAPDEYGLIARVRNIGQAAVPAGVPVGFYAGDPQMGGTALGTELTGNTLYPAEAEDVRLMLANPPEDLIKGLIDAYVVVDDGMPDHPWHECRTDNNVGQGPGKCFGPG